MEQFRQLEEQQRQQQLEEQERERILRVQQEQRRQDELRRQQLEQQQIEQQRLLLQQKVCALCRSARVLEHYSSECCTAFCLELVGSLDCNFAGKYTRSPC